MTELVPQGVCSQPSCSVANDGICAEGRVISQCPSFTLLASQDQTDDSGGDLADDANNVSARFPSRIRLHAGDALKAEETKYITRASLARVILVAGGPESGKSSLITCVYHQFQNGSYGNYLFAGCDTFHGYELRCASDRVASGLAEPTTERTQNIEGQIDFLHLAVREKENKRPVQHLLFSDLSGEKFQQARTLASGTDQLEMFRRADHFVLLIDGESLINPSQRHREASQAKTLLRSLIERQILNTKSLVSVLFSKWDLIVTDPDRDAIVIFKDQLASDIRQRYSPYLGDIQVFEIAAQPKRGELKAGYGLGKVFQYWVESSSLTVGNGKLFQGRSTSSRAFCRFELIGSP